MSNELALQDSNQLKVQVEVANQFPRQLTTFVDDVFSVVVRDQKFSMSCIYCVPVGKQKDGTQKFVTGPSVRLSEEMQKYWKHLRVAVSCEITADQLIVSGMVVDCQANNAETLVDQVSIKGWSDRRISLKAKAMQSTMKRDLRMSIIGKSYADELQSKIMNALFEKQQEVLGFCLSAYAEIGVPEETLCSYFKVKALSELDNEQLFRAIGMYNYLKDNSEDPSYIFGGENTSSKPETRAPVEKPKADAQKADVKPTTKVKQAEKNLSFLDQLGELSKKLGKSLDQMDAIITAEFGFKDAACVKSYDEEAILDHFKAMVSAKK